MFPSLEYEEALYTQGYRHVAGLDEAGRGAWAGPVIAAAVVLPPDAPGLREKLAGVRDSKLLSPPERERLYDVIKEAALCVSVGTSSHRLIDSHGIVPATRRAMRVAVAKLHPRPDFLLIDALSLPRVDVPQLSFFKADMLSLTVASASIIAKVWRDRLMVELSESFPAYNLAQHKGYGTPAHREALWKFGPCRVHRKSFAPVRRCLEAIAGS